MTDDSPASATPEPQLYRQLIDWTARLAREGDALLERLAIGGPGRLLDLGCGTGEHARWLGERGHQVVAVDRSPEMVEAARAVTAAGAAVRFEVADLAALPPSIAGPFDGALCLGNTLPHLLDAAAMEAACRGVAERLRRGGRWVIQLLNYEAILAERRRAFPPLLRPGDDGGELVFLRFMDHHEPGHVEFESIVLERRADASTRLRSARRSRLRAWTRADLAPILGARFAAVDFLGGLDGGRFVASSSSDLVVVAERG